MSEFCHRAAVPDDRDAPRLAVKCSIDVAGWVSHAGNAALRDHAPPAATDAPIVAQARQAGAVVVGHTVMPEFGLNATGVNEVMGTPTNPLAPDRVPGGSSSGTAVALATEQADVGYGTDAGGSCRIPAACCGIVGLKPTQDRFDTRGVVSLTFTMDVAGPLAPDVAGIVRGLTWMDPTFAAGEQVAGRIGRLRVDGVAPHIDAAVDGALQAWAQAGDVEVVDLEQPGCWRDAYTAGGILLVDEGWQQHGHLLESHPDGFTTDGANRLRVGSYVDDDKRAWVKATRERVRAEFDALLEQVDLLALPTIGLAPPLLDEVGPEHDLELTRLTVPFNLSGHPALAMPVPTSGGHPVPASLQLVGPWRGEELLVPSAADLEATLR